MWCINNNHLSSGATPTVKGLIETIYFDIKNSFDIEKNGLNNRFNLKTKLQENVVIKPKSNLLNTKVVG